MTARIEARRLSGDRAVAEAAVRLAQEVLAGFEHTVDEARERGSSSTIALGYAIELLDDLLDPEDDRLDDLSGVSAGSSGGGER